MHLVQIVQQCLYIYVDTLSLYVRVYIRVYIYYLYIYICFTYTTGLTGTNGYHCLNLVVSSMGSRGNTRMASELKLQGLARPSVIPSDQRFTKLLFCSRMKINNFLGPGFTSWWRVSAFCWLSHVEPVSPKVNGWTEGALHFPGAGTRAVTPRRVAVRVLAAQKSQTRFDSFQSGPVVSFYILFLCDCGGGHPGHPSLETP